MTGSSKRDIEKERDDAPLKENKTMRSIHNCRGSAGLWVLLGIILVVLIALGQQGGKEVARESSARGERIKDLSLKYDWYKGGFDTVMMANLTIQNKGTVAMKDVEIECEVSGASGTKLGTLRKTVYQTIKPKSKIVVREFHIGLINTQASNAHCGIIDAQ